MTAENVEHAFTDLNGAKVTMTAKRSGPPGLRLTPVVTVRIETPDGDFSQMSFPAVAAAAFARVLDCAVRFREHPDGTETSPYPHPDCGGVVAYEERTGARDVWRCQRCGATVTTEVPDAT